MNQLLTDTGNKLFTHTGKRIPNDKDINKKYYSKDQFQNYQPVLKSSQIKPCIQLKRRIFRRSGSIQHDTDT